MPRLPSLLPIGICLISLFLLTSSQLVIQEAGFNGKRGPTLSSNYTNFCPRLFSSKGFSVLCLESPTANSATFFLGKRLVRFEQVAPYALNGDFSGAIQPWTDYSALSVIKCVLSDGVIHVGRLRIECPSPSPTPSVSPPSTTPFPQAGDMVFYEAGLSGDTGPIIYDGITFCPESFLSAKFSVRCIGSPTSTSAKFFVNNRLRRTETKTPFFFKGASRKGFIKPWSNSPKSFQLRCELDDGTVNSARVTISCEDDDDIKPSPEAQDLTGCIVINVKDTITTPLPDGWVEVEDGLAFRQGNRSHAVTAKRDATLEYIFFPPLTSRYGFIVDMTTVHPVDYNDVWALMPGGFSLMRDGVARSYPGLGYIKVYHNANGRATVSNSIDFNPHSISTYKTLKQGSRVKAKIGGRSNRVIIHRIIMFTCSGTSCDRSSAEWRTKLRRCKNL